jgi:hypothetical protein
MSIPHQTDLDQEGKPTAALIPWDAFIELVEAQGHDLDDNERSELREALADSKADQAGAFVPAHEV